MQVLVVGVVLGEALHMLGGRPKIATVIKHVGGTEACRDAVKVCLVLVGHKHGDAVVACGVVGGELKRWSELVCHSSSEVACCAIAPTAVV